MSCMAMPSQSFGPHAARGCAVVADVRTHPGVDFQSHSGPLAARDGHIAIILPDFARHTLLGGDEIVGLREDTVCLSRLSKNQRLAAAVRDLGIHCRPLRVPAGLMLSSSPSRHHAWRGV